MPAEVESAFTVREPAWWDRDKKHVFDRNPASVDEALEWAGLTWEPIRSPVFRVTESHQCESINVCDQLAVAEVSFTDKTGKADIKYACGRHANVAKSKGYPVKSLPLRQIAGQQSVFRSDTGEDFPVKNTDYELFSNRETAELVEILLDSKATDVKDPVQFETGGSLLGGRKVWFLARIDKPLEVPGDSSPYYPYVSVLNSHDGSAALKAVNSTIRIVCWNTWVAAENQGRSFTFRHTKTIRDRVEDARKVLMGATDEALEWVEYATKMVAIPITDAQVQQFLTEFVPTPPVASDRVVRNVEEARNAIKKFYHGPSCASIAGTAWGLVQATGEYLDHGRTWRSRDTYVTRTMLKPESGKQQAMKLVKELVKA